MASEYPPSGSRVSSARRRILVVDDNADSADLLVQLLEIHGHDARSANTAAEAWSTASEFQPEIAILDVGLPDMPGYELANRFRSNAQLQTCKLIAVTGYAGDTESLRHKMADFDMHFMKPVDLALLARCVGEHGAVEQTASNG